VEGSGRNHRLNDTDRVSFHGADVRYTPALLLDEQIPKPRGVYIDGQNVNVWGIRSLRNRGISHAAADLQHQWCQPTEHLGSIDEPCLERKQLASKPR
jgi:hypothetical protein